MSQLLKQILPNNSNRWSQAGTWVFFAGGEKPSQVPEGAEKKEFTDESDQKLSAAERLAHLEALKNKTQEGATHDAKIEAEGTAQDYVEEFRLFMHSPDFEPLALSLEISRKTMDPEGLENFENWTRYDPKQVGDLIEKWPNFARSRRGRGAFIAGLKEGTTESKSYKESDAALKQIVQDLKDYFEKQRKTMENLQAQQEKTPVPQMLGDGVKNLVNNFQRGSGLEKGLMVGAGLVGLYLLNKYKDTQLPILNMFSKDFSTPQGLALLAGALWSVNYISGKVANDGKSILQRIDLGHDLNALDNNPTKAFALESGMENAEKYRAFIALQNVDIKDLYREYRDAKSGKYGPKKEINPSRLGFSRKAINGEALYDLVGDVIKAAGVNRGEQQKKQEIFKAMIDAKKEGKTYSGPYYLPSQPGSAERLFWESEDWAVTSFAKKYIHGPLGKEHMTLGKVAFNEYQSRNWEVIIGEGEAEHLPNRAARKVEDLYKDLRYIHGPAAYDYVVNVGKNIGIKSKNFLKPLGKHAKARWERIKPALKFLPESTAAFYQKGQLERAIPDSFGIKVTDAAPIFPGQKGNGVATILGVPGVKFVLDIDSDSGVKTATIEGVTFNLDAEQKGNKQQIKELEEKLGQKVKDALAGTPLANNTVEWNVGKKEWTVKKVKALGEPKLGINDKDVDLRLTFGADGKPEYFIDSQKINDVNNIGESYVSSLIEEQIWKASPSLAKHLEGLPVAVKKQDIQVVGTDVFMTGTIAGLEFKVKVTSLPLSGASGGVELVDPTAPGGKADFKKLKIEESKGGEAFILRKSAQILASGEFQNPFAKLEALIDNTDESFLSRMSDMFPTRKWIIPTSINLSAGLNGKVLQRQWKFLLDHKKMEVMDHFQKQMQGKALEDMPKVYDDTVQNARLFAEALSRDIEAAANNEERADKFGSYMDRLETLGYTNTEYKALFKEYKAVISDPRYNFKGAEKFGDVSLKVGDETWGAADESYEIYNVLLRIWDIHTSELAHEDPTATNPSQEISQANKDKIRYNVIEKVRERLERLQADHGAISLDNIGPHETEADLDKWIDPTWNPNAKRLWFSK